MPHWGNIGGWKVFNSCYRFIKTTCVMVIFAVLSH